MDGLPIQAKKALTELVQDAILQRHQLLIISEGTLLAGLYMHDNRWRDTAALCIAIEIAAKTRSKSSRGTPWRGIAAEYSSAAALWGITHLNATA